MNDLIFVRPLRAIQFILLLWAVCNSSAGETNQWTHGAVASVHPLATQAGLAALQNGGNAIDAAVAVALTLGVVDADNAGLGGGCFILIRRANGELVAIDGRETAPAAATRDMFIRNGKADPSLSQTGPLASGVPGALAAYEYATKHFGRKKLKDLILPAAEIAENGFTVPAAYANRLKSVEKEMSRFAATRDVFFVNEKPVAAGQLLKQPDLARSYRQIAAHGGAWFYRGPFAQATAQWMRANGGIMTSKDLADYRIIRRTPIYCKYRDYDLIAFPPPSSGGVHVIQILNILERFDLRQMSETDRDHVIAEAMKLAFADRAYWLGDPAYAKVPRALISKTYARELSLKINPDRVTAVAGHGWPGNWQSDVFKKHTTHFSVADNEGNWVACTATLNTSFGSKVVIPGTGIIMNDEMDDFSAQPGVPNYFGLVGAEANAVAPGKRPLSSMSPTIVLHDGNPCIAIGAAGGPKIISQVVLGLIGMIDLQLSPVEAISAPRFHQQWSPDELMVEPSLPKRVVESLASKGHKISETPGMGVSQVVARKPGDQGFTAAADPHAGGLAAGY